MLVLRVYTTVIGVPKEDICLKLFGKNKDNFRIKKTVMLGSKEKIILAS